MGAGFTSIQWDSEPRASLPCGMKILTYWHAPAIICRMGQVAEKAGFGHSHLPGRTLGLKAENSGELIRQVGRGFSFHLLLAFESRSGISFTEIAAIIGIPPRTLARRKSSGRLTSDESEKLLRLSSVFEQAVDLFEGDESNARQWLTTAK